jgi:hypothetical protein
MEFNHLTASNSITMELEQANTKVLQIDWRVAERGTISS